MLSLRHPEAGVHGEQQAHADLSGWDTIASVTVQPRSEKLLGAGKGFRGDRDPELVGDPLVDHQLGVGEQQLVLALFASRDAVHELGGLRADRHHARPVADQGALGHERSGEAVDRFARLERLAQQVAPRRLRKQQGIGRNPQRVHVVLEQPAQRLGYLALGGNASRQDLQVQNRRRLLSLGRSSRPLGAVDRTDADRAGIHGAERGELVACRDRERDTPGVRGSDEPHRFRILDHAEDERELGRPGARGSGGERANGDQNCASRLELSHDAIRLGPVAAQVVLGDGVARRGSLELLERRSPGGHLGALEHGDLGRRSKPRHSGGDAHNQDALATEHG